MDDNKGAYTKQLHLAIASFFIELPNFVFIMFAALMTGSLITWMDLIDSFRNIASEGLMVFMSKKLSHDLRFEYNYGVEKVEAIAGLGIDCLLFSGVGIFTFFSINELMNPSQPSGLLLYVIFLKVADVIIDFVCHKHQEKITEAGNSTLMESELANSFSALVFDLIALVAVFVSYIFRGNPVSWAFSPIASLAMEAYFIVGCVKRIRSSISVLTDHTLPENEQMIILKAINASYMDYDELISIKSHRSGNTTHIDLVVSFSPETKYSDIVEFCNKTSEMIEQELEDSHVSIIIS